MTNFLLQSPAPAGLFVEVLMHSTRPISLRNKIANNCSQFSQTEKSTIPSDHNHHNEADTISNARSNDSFAQNAISNQSANTMAVLQFKSATPRSTVKDKEIKAPEVFFEKLWTVEELSASLKVSVKTIYDWVHKKNDPLSKDQSLAQIQTLAN